MRFLKTVLLSVCLALFVFACNQAANNTANNASVTTNNSRANSNTPANTTASTPFDELASGKSVYLERCVKCHKENGSGGAVDVMGEKHTAANFTSERLKKDTDEEFVKVIENGEVEEGMPAFKGKLTEEQIKSVVKYIRKEFQGK